MRGGGGFSTEAASAVVALARDTGVTDLRAVVFADNIASARVCARLGMTAYSPTREWYGVEMDEFRLDERRSQAPISAASPAVMRSSSSYVVGNT